MVKIRLFQTGTKNRKQYRIVAIDEHKRRNGRIIENLGWYDPLVKPARIEFARDRVSYWLSQGAQYTDGTRKILEDKMKSTKAV